MKKLYILPIIGVIVIYSVFGMRSTVVEMLYKGISESYNNTYINPNGNNGYVESNTGNPEDYLPFGEDPTIDYKSVDINITTTKIPAEIFDSAVLEIEDFQWAVYLDHQGGIYVTEKLSYYNRSRYEESSANFGADVPVYNDYVYFVNDRILDNTEGVIEVASSHELGVDNHEFFAFLTDEGRVYTIQPDQMYGREFLNDSVVQLVGSLFYSMELTGQEKIVSFEQINYEGKDILVLKSSLGKLFRFVDNHFIRIESGMDLPQLYFGEYVHEYLNENNDEYNNIITTNQNRVFVKRYTTSEYRDITDLIVNDGDNILKAVFAEYHNRVIFVMESGVFVVYDIDDQNDLVIRLDALNLDENEYITKIQSNQNTESYYNMFILTNALNVLRISENKVVTSFEDYSTTFRVFRQASSDLFAGKVVNFEVSDFKSEIAAISGIDYSNNYSLICYMEEGYIQKVSNERYRTITEDLDYERTYTEIVSEVINETY